MSTSITKILLVLESKVSQQCISISPVLLDLDPQLQVDLGISSRIYLEKDAFYNPTPMFMLRTRK